MKLLFLLFIFPFTAQAISNTETKEALVDAQVKQTAFEEFMRTSSFDAKENLRLTSIRTNLDKILEITSYEPYELNIEDVYFCKVAFQFNKLRGQETNIFRTRVKADSENIARDEIKKSCLTFAKDMKNKEFICKSIQKKSTVCINPKKPNTADIRRWMRVY